MKYSETIIKRTMKAIENCPLHTFWNIRISAQCEGLDFCEITFETVDGVRMSIAISGTTADAGIYNERGKYIWLTGCNLDKCNYDTYMMWLGAKLDRLYTEAMKIELETA